MNKGTGWERNPHLNTPEVGNEQATSPSSQHKVGKLQHCFYDYYFNLLLLFFDWSTGFQILITILCLLTFANMFVTYFFLHSFLYLTPLTWNLFSSAFSLSFQIYKLGFTLYLLSHECLDQLLYHSMSCLFLMEMQKVTIFASVMSQSF